MEIRRAMSGLLNFSSILRLIVVIALGTVALGSSLATYAETTVVVRASDTERQPRDTVVPRYPPKARELRLEGSVTVCFVIKADGKVTAAKVTSSSHRWFEKPALAAIRQSTFEPQAMFERPVRLKACRSYNFSLKPVQNPLAVEAE